MHVISREPFVHASERNPKHAKALLDVYKTLKQGSYSSPDELKNIFPSLDRMKYREKWWVIDVGGNALRILFFADFKKSKIFIKHISTHAEYNKLMNYYRRT
ncbi:mRNA interferase HigB [Providencia rustigianii]|uniref:mRNA interferase HigB n=1 Tax=Providencia rustigianii TaxID=158850 RepID=A0A379G2R6_9GAMM|nr:MULTISPECIES: type II toxin-antitoxin system HigB family toxin [Providencia]MTC57089.1 cytoplasmic protein [Providencia rustigianii]SUC35152.1 mRNA interferase HigB [Providencia rustigianii]VEB68517.1 mRNA interferase HigB [Providencia rustigianii]